jgi:bile acid:Na+ symporter, BASS family
MKEQAALGIVAVFYAVANLASMGLELKLREAIQSLWSIRVLGLTLGWSWVLGPSFAVLLTKILPMAEPYAIGLLIFSLAPTAPALPLFIRMARADMSLAAAIMPMSVVGTVVMMPLMAPFLIPGLTVSGWAIGKPLLLTVLLPLVIGVAIKVYASRVADKIFPAVKKIAGISTLLLLAFTLVFHGRALLTTLGSFAVGAQVLFILGMALASYTFGFGLNQAQRSAMALGVCSRNGGAMFVAITAFPNLDPKLLVMILLAVPVPVIVWAALAKFFASQAKSTEAFAT